MRNNSKKKVIVIILAILVLAIALLFLLKGCQKEEPVVHNHSYKINEEGTWICSDDNDILSNTDKPYVAILEDNQPKNILAIDSLSKSKINLGNGTIYKDGNNIYYSGNNAQTIIIKTQKVDNKQDDKDALVINAPLDTVYHYGSSTVISLDAVATNSFHEYGKVDLITLTKARVVLENPSDVKEIYLDINDTNYSYETTIIALKENVELPRLTRDAVDLEEGEVKTLAIVQKLKDEVKTETNEETNEVIETVLEVQTGDDNYVKIENVKKSNDELIIEAFLSPNAKEDDNTKTESQTTSVITLEEAKEGSSHPASTNTFVSKEEKVVEVVKPEEVSKQEETRQEEAKPVVKPTKKEEIKPEEEEPAPAPYNPPEESLYIVTYVEKIGDGETFKFIASLNDVVWSSSNEEIATIDATGNLIAHKPGNATITVSKGTKTAIKDIEVTEFHSGEGSESNPFIVYNAKQFDRINNQNSVANKYYKLGNDIDLSESTIINDNTYRFECVKNKMNNVSLDGNGHAVKSTNPNIGSIVGDLVNSEIKNVEFKTASPVIGYINTSNFEDINVDVINTLYFSNNSGIIGYYVYDVDLYNVNINANVVGSYYNGVFMGYNFGGTYNMINCSYSGNFVSVYSGLVFGNPTYSGATINIKNFTNNGIIRHTNVSGIDKDYCLYGICNDGQYQSKTVSIDNVDYSGEKSKNCTLSGAGEYIIGPEDSGLTISLNDDKTFKVTKSSDSNVSYYEVEIVANVPNLGPFGGSTNISVQETIESDGSDCYTTTLKDYGFANGDAPSGKLGNIDIINIGGIDYYWEENPDYYCEVRGLNTMVFVRAYDNERVLLSVATLSRN